MSVPTERIYRHYFNSGEYRYWFIAPGVWTLKRSEAKKFSVYDLPFLPLGGVEIEDVTPF